MKQLVFALGALLCLAACWPARADGPVFPPTNLYPANGATNGTQLATRSGATNSVPASDFLNNATYWTLTGLTATGGATTAPDFSTNMFAFNTGTGATEMAETAATVANGGRNAWDAIYVASAGNGVQFMYVELIDSAGTDSVTEWFDVLACAPQSTAVTGTGTLHLAYAEYVPSVVGSNGTYPAACLIGISATGKTAPNTAGNMIVGVSSAVGSTTWSGGSGAQVNLWGAEIVLTSAAGLSANALPLPHVSTPAASSAVTAAPNGIITLGASTSNRPVYIQATPPSVASVGGSGSATIGNPATDAAGSFTTGTSSTGATLTFAGSPVPWSAPPLCYATPLASGVTAYRSSTPSTTAVTFTFSSALTGIEVDYHCEEPLQ